MGKNRNHQNMESTEPTDKDGAIAEGEGWTYVGGGADSPRVINFMGMQKFVRGQLTQVTNPTVLAKLQAGNQCFALGEVDEEDLYEHDAEATAAEQAQMEVDKRTAKAYLKKHGGE